VGRDVGGHADGDALGAVDQQVREAGRQHQRLAPALVVVGLEVDRILVDVLEQGLGGARQPRLGVAHGRRRIVVHGAEVALPVDELEAHGEVLRHPHQRLVDRAVAVRVVGAHDVADDVGRLPERLVGIVAALLHRPENPAVDGLQPVAHVGQRTRHDDAHGVVEVGAFHLLLDGHGRDVEGRRVGRRVQANS